MKLSLITAAAVAALTFAAGCGVSEADKNPEAPPPAEPTPPEPPPGRKLVDGTVMSTSPVNLLADPGFSLVGRQQPGYGSFIALYEGSSREFELAATLDSRSPAGFGGAVALVRPDKATDKKSQAVVLLTSFIGGKGPFHAKIWASKSDVAGNPVDIPTDDSAVKVSVMDGPPEAPDAFDLAVDPSATRTVDGRTWILLRGDIAKPLANGGFFLVRTGTKGGHIHLAAPEVTSDELVIGQAVKSRSSLKLAEARTKSGAERRVIAAYRSMPPRLVPAAPKAQLAD